MVECVYHGLDALGYDVQLCSDADKLDGNTILIGAIYLSAAEMRRLPPHTVNYNCEHSSSRWIDYPAAAYRTLLRAVPIWDYSADNASRLRRAFGVDARFVPLGYVPQLTRAGKAQTDIDVLFFGSPHERRDAILRQLRELGLRTHAAFGVYGAARDELIARSKVIVNIHYYLPGAFEISRVGYALANAKAVVTECNAGESVDADLADALVAAPYDQLAAACLALVRDDARRGELERRALAAFCRRDESVILAHAIASLPGRFLA
jgi:hypothetical protein